MNAFPRRVVATALLAGALALIILSAISSAIPRKSNAKSSTIYGSSPVMSKLEKVSVDFPDTTVGEFCTNLSDLFEMRIHAPTTLTDRKLSLKMKDANVLELLKSGLKDFGVEVRLESHDIYITERELSHEYPKSDRIISLSLVLLVGISMLAAFLFLGRFLCRSFVEHHKIDLGGTLGLVFIIAGLGSVLDWLNTTVLGTSRELEVSGALSIIMGIGFWHHMRWARILGLAGGWIGAVALCLIVIVGTSQVGTLSIMISGVKMSDPSLGKASLVLLESGAAIFALLAVLHSKKAHQEFVGGQKF